MEYIHTDDCQIRSDIAFRLGVIIMQYEKSIELNDIKNYNSTLCISVLQTLLTNCLEILREIKFINVKYDFFDIENQLIDDNFYGIKNKSIILNSIYDKVTLHRVLISLRNALSHPTNINIKSEFPSTGYTTIKDGSNIISEYIFVDSPDVKNNRAKSFNNIAELELHKRMNKSAVYDYNSLKTVPRLFIFKLDVSELKTLTLNLSKVLAQPVQENWNKVFNPLILSNLKVA
jgi:hypothetical protein